MVQGNVFPALPCIVEVAQGGKRTGHTAMYVTVTSQRESGAFSHGRTEFIPRDPYAQVLFGAPKLGLRFLSRPTREWRRGQ